MSLTPMAHCARCTTAPTQAAPRIIQRRFLSSSLPLRIITPESPRYLEVPESLQTQQPPLKPIKGILPVPRPVVDKRREYKATPEWLANTTPEPSRTIDLNKVPPHLRERTVYRQRLAETRRRSLRQGVSELYKRAVKTEQELDSAREKRTLDDLKALNAPRRHDEVWTNISVSKAVRDALKRKSTERLESDTERAERKAEAAKRDEKSTEDRLQSIHQLYLHAKDFITDEAQLDQEIDKLFGSEEYPVTWSSNAKSVWALGMPASTSDMASISKNTGDRLGRDNNQDRMNQRIRAIAGRLTGGKIPVPETKGRSGFGSSQGRYNL